MSDLIYQNYSNKCKGWVNPSNLFFGPEIISLTGYQSPAGSNTLVSIIGANFFSYSIIRFGTFTPTVYFINSTLLSFYIPNTLNSGTFPVQVCNGSVCSNIVNYTIDMASGYWMINAGGNTNTISNTNPNGVQVSWLSRGSTAEGIINITNDPNTNSSTGGNPYVINNFNNWIICDGNEGTVGPIYIQLPSDIIYTGREIMFKNLANQEVKSTQPNILALNSYGISDLILPNVVGKWATLVYDGSNWITMQGNY